MSDRAPLEDLSFRTGLPKKSAAVHPDRQLLLQMNQTYCFLTDQSEGQLHHMFKGNHQFWNGDGSLDTKSNVASDRFCNSKGRITF